MARQSAGQKKTVERVMHEFKHHELEAGSRPVKNRKQAIAIALSEAGESRNQSKSQNKRRLQHTKTKERRGETARDQKEGPRASTRRASSGRSSKRSTARRGGSSNVTRAELYAKARRRNIPGRSRMNKAELERALRR